ncbi:MAG: tetratricopeptide repeat protein [Chloroflexi bacterium]|nr:tetratricopeptide repeat protein [Chloroflexota bacterium]
MDSDRDITKAQAMILFEQAYRHQVNGKLGDAVELYKRSLAMHPTAEAYTFLGWAYSMVDRIEEAIEMCHKAIEIDPTFGNPYNDLGAYMIDQGQYEDAVAWLEKAIDAPRYSSPQFPYTNLGRVYQKLGRYRTALNYYDDALEIDPLYMPAQWAKAALLGKMN